MLAQQEHQRKQKRTCVVWGIVIGGLVVISPVTHTAVVQLLLHGDIKNTRQLSCVCVRAGMCVCVYVFLSVCVCVCVCVCMCVCMFIVTHIVPFCQADCCLPIIPQCVTHHSDSPMRSTTHT